MKRMLDPVAAGIKVAIAQRGMMKKYVAEKSGFTEKQFSNMLNGRKVIRAEYLPSIARALDVNVSDLFADTGHPSA